MASETVFDWVRSKLFQHVAADTLWANEVESAAKRGTIVHIMRSVSLLDFLCLDHLIEDHSLPPLRFVNDLGRLGVEPSLEGGRKWAVTRQLPQEQAITQVVRARQSALLFLLRPPTLGESRKGQGLDVDLLVTLVREQRRLRRPIILLPQSILWTERPPHRAPATTDLLFGTSQWPGRVRVGLRFLLNHRNVRLRVGQPFDLQHFLAARPKLDDLKAADALRYALLRRIERERRILQGPHKKSPGRIREELLRSPRLKGVLAKRAKQEGKSIEAIERAADGELRRLCAAPDPNVLSLASPALDRLWDRIYDGVVVDEEGVDRLRRAARLGPLIFLPSHKSHVDYLVLSHVLAKRGISPPLIAAGENLSFFPLGPLLRRGGAFFIRRRFSGKRLYGALVEAYLRKVLAEGFNLEFFMEGGRSRTGKLLPPQLGLLSMVIDAGLKLPGVELSFVPVSIGYERVVEAGAYARELRGEDKPTDSVAGLLRSTRVLRSRYGRLYVNIGQIATLTELVGEGRGRRPSSPLQPKERRALITQLGHQMSHEINRVTVVTPSALVATALLQTTMAVSRATLDARCRFFYRALLLSDARIAQVLTDEYQDAVERALDLFREAKLVSTRAGENRAEPGRRLALEYHKNNTLHFLVPRALIASALRLKGTDGGSLRDLLDRTRELSRLFKHEFAFRVDAPIEAIFEQTLESMGLEGLLQVVGPDWKVLSTESLTEYANLLSPYFEAYGLVLSALSTLSSGATIRRKSWLNKTLNRGRRELGRRTLRFPESTSRHKLDNALKAFHAQGLIRLTAKNIERGAAFADVSTMTSLEVLLGSS